MKKKAMRVSLRLNKRAGWPEGRRERRESWGGEEEEGVHWGWGEMGSSVGCGGNESAEKAGLGHSAAWPAVPFGGRKRKNLRSGGLNTSPFASSPPFRFAADMDRVTEREKATRSSSRPWVSPVDYGDVQDGEGGGEVAFGFG